jgi:hypothetical protein
MFFQALAGTLWSGLAFLNGKLAESKGDRGLKWVLLSMPLGPLATVLILARPVVKPRHDDEAA